MNIVISYLLRKIIGTTDLVHDVILPYTVIYSLTTELFINFFQPQI